MSGKPGRSGRKRIMLNTDQGRHELYAMLPLAISGIRAQLKPRGKDLICPHCGEIAAYESGYCEDKQLLMYVVDQVLGRPRQSIDAKVGGEVRITADELASILLGLRGEERAILAKYDLSPPVVSVVHSDESERVEPPLQLQAATLVEAVEEET